MPVGEWGKGWPQPGWWDWKAEPAESKGPKTALTLLIVSGPFVCEGNRFPEAGLQASNHSLVGYLGI